MMGKRLDLIGRRFTRLLIIEFSHIDKNKHSHWKVLCDCGTKKTVDSSNLRRKLTKSCGCLNSEMRIETNTTHGMSYTVTHKSWRHMKERCLNPKSKSYKDYGGRGITICKRWLDTFENFYEDMGEKPRRLTLNRIDNDGDYEPDNCKWSSAKEQANNKRSNHILTYNGIVKTLAQWAEYLGIKRGVIDKRLKRGWTIEKALEVPVRGAI